MKKIYEAPALFCDEFVADTMIASYYPDAKSGNPGNNQNCWGADEVQGHPSSDGTNLCNG